MRRERSTRQGDVRSTRRRPVSSSVLAAAVGVAALVSAAASSAATGVPPVGVRDRGEVVSVRLLRSWRVGRTAAALRAAHFDDRSVRYGVRLYRLDVGTPEYDRSRHLGSNVAATDKIAHWFTSVH